MFTKNPPAPRYLGTPCKRGHSGWRYVSSKVCIECSDEYAKLRRANATPDQLAEWNAKTVAWQDTNKTRYLTMSRYRRIREKYGITPEEYDALVDKQNGLCAVCLKVCPQNDRLSIDHCHETKVIRGLLCHKCNIGLGWFKDDPQNLERAAAYIRSHLNDPPSLRI